MWFCLAMLIESWNSLGWKAVKSIQEVLATLLRLLIALATQKRTWFVSDLGVFSERDHQCCWLL